MIKSYTRYNDIPYIYCTWYFFKKLLKIVLLTCTYEGMKKPLCGMRGKRSLLHIVQ